MIKHIFLAAGGTGGHIFPAQALAEELVKRGHKVTFITDDRFKGYKGAFANLADKVNIVEIQSGSPSGKGVIKGVWKLLVGAIQCIKLIKQKNPDVVVGFGGYPSFAPIFVGSAFRKTTIIHEQNAVFGRANRFLLDKVSRVATSFDDMDEDAVFTGNPVRSEIVEVRSKSYPDLAGKINLLVLGGSQGASVFSRVIPDGIALLSEELRQKIRITQQCKTDTEIKDLSQKYKELGVEAELALFFDDMPVKLANTHLIISRSGASSVAEITTAGIPSILVPYKYATDDHQTKNANYIVDKGFGWMISEPNFDGTYLAEKLTELFSDTNTLSDISSKMKAEKYTNPAEKLAILVEA